MSEKGPQLRYTLSQARSRLQLSSPWLVFLVGQWFENPYSLFRVRCMRAEGLTIMMVVNHHASCSTHSVISHISHVTTSSFCYSCHILYVAADIITTSTTLLLQGCPMLSPLSWMTIATMIFTWPTPRSTVWRKRLILYSMHEILAWSGERQAQTKAYPQEYRIVLVPGYLLYQTPRGL